MNCVVPTLKNKISIADLNIHIFLSEIISVLWNYIISKRKKNRGSKNRLQSNSIPIDSTCYIHFILHYKLNFI